MNIKAETLSGQDLGEHRGRPLHVIFDSHRTGMRSRSFLVGIEGWKPRRGGWYRAVHVRVLNCYRPQP